MLVIRIMNATARWDSGTLRWRCANKVIKDILNIAFQQEDYSPVEINFRDDGSQGVALNAALKVFGDELKVMKHTQWEPPPELPGVVV
jgi:hypothetical protein